MNCKVNNKDKYPSEYISLNFYSLFLNNIIFNQMTTLIKKIYLLRVRIKIQTHAIQ